MGEFEEGQGSIEYEQASFHVSRWFETMLPCFRFDIHVVCVMGMSERTLVCIKAFTSHSCAAFPRRELVVGSRHESSMREHPSGLLAQQEQSIWCHTYTKSTLKGGGRDKREVQADLLACLLRQTKVIQVRRLSSSLSRLELQLCLPNSCP